MVEAVGIPCGVQEQLDTIAYSWWDATTDELKPFFELALDFVNHVPPCVRHKLRLAYQFSVQQRMPSAHALNFFPPAYIPEQDIKNFEDTGNSAFPPTRYRFNTIVLYSWLTPVNFMIRKETHNIRKLSMLQRRVRMWVD